MYSAQVSCNVPEDEIIIGKWKVSHETPSLIHHEDLLCDASIYTLDAGGDIITVPLQHTPLRSIHVLIRMLFRLNQ